MDIDNCFTVGRVESRPDCYGERWDTAVVTHKTDGQRGKLVLHCLKGSGEVAVSEPINDGLDGDTEIHRSQLPAELLRNKTKMGFIQEDWTQICGAVVEALTSYFEVGELGMLDIELSNESVYQYGWHNVQPWVEDGVPH